MVGGDRRRPLAGVETDLAVRAGSWACRVPLRGEGGGGGHRRAQNAQMAGVYLSRETTVCGLAEVEVGLVCVR